MNRFRSLVASCAVCLAALLAACQAPPTETTNNQPSTTTTNATAQPSMTPAAASAADERNARNIPVTLPVLDYLFQSDESFSVDLRSRLALTDDELNRLKQAAREETGKLREDGAEEYTGSTREAISRADEQLRTILGAEKAAEFTRFARTRLAGEEGGNADANSMNATTTSANGAGAGGERPNAVPTDTRIVVNAPAFRMDVFQGGQLVKTYKVGIGYPEFPLPVGKRRLDTIIFNPTWTPPDEPWVEASGKVKVGETVAAGSKLNPLGPIKIPIGSPSLIHGGKSTARLGSFASHGCVGLTNEGVQDVALVLAKITSADLTPEAIKNYEKQKTETKNFKLPQGIPVELRYETIVVEDGKLRIFRDVYDRDTNTEQNLRRTLEAHGVSFDSLPEQDRARILEALRQMSRDAEGNLDASGTNTNGGNTSGGNTSTASLNANTNSANVNRSGNANANKNTNTGGERVTRNIKGQKEITLELAQLAGKGYPAPMNLYPAGSQTKPQSNTNRKRA